MVIGSKSFGSVKVSCEIDQFSSDLRSGKAKVLFGRLRFDAAQCLVEPKSGRLKDFIGVRPTLESWIVFEHPTGKFT